MANESIAGFTAKTLESDLGAPTELSRLLQKDIERRQSLPFSIAAGAQKSDIIQITYAANAGAGNFTAAVDLKPLALTTQPLILVWYMGSIDKSGTKYPGGGIIPGSPFATGTVLSGAEINSGAIANYCATETTLTVKITSTNVGISALLVGYFFYAVYYDETSVSTVGL